MSGDPDLQQVRVLMVDDDPTVGKTVKAILSPAKVTFAQSAAGALARLQAGGDFSAILCDIFMPGMDGMQFHEEVKKISRDLAHRIIFISAGASVPEAAGFLRRTGNRCLRKPIKREELLMALLATVPEARGSAQEGPAGGGPYQKPGGS